MLKRKIIVLLLALSLFSPINVHSKGLHFGIISAIKQKVRKLKEQKEEATKIKLAENTKVLDDETEQQLIKIEDQTYYFSKDATEIENLSIGDIIIGTRGEGFLRKITAINPTADEYVVETTTATLEEAFEKLEIEFTKTFTESDINPQQAPQLKKGVRIQKITPEGEFTISISSSVVLYDLDGNYVTTNDQIVAEGILKFKLGVDFKIKIEYFDLKELKFIKTVEETSEINLIAGIKKSWEKEIELGKIYFAPIPVGPVILVPEATIVIGANANAGLVVTAGITQTATIRTGLDYNRGTWTPITDFSTDFDYSPPSLTIAGDIKGYAGPKLALKIYGVTGPYANVNGYFKLDAQLSPENFWKLYGGLEGIGGVEMTVLSFVKVSHEATLIDYKVVIASGTISTNQSPAISSLTANPTSVSTGENSTITCSASDPDEDTLSYSWSKTDGTITGSGSQVTWTAPSSEGTYTITCTVNDGNGGTDQETVNITVSSIDAHELPDTGQYGDYTAIDGEDSDYNFAASSPSYTDNEDGTITDNITGLMWVKDGASAGCFDGNTMTWEIALSSCETLSFAGHDDWRLPNRRELMSIVNFGDFNPAVIDTYFPNTQSLSYYWTSTTHFLGVTEAWEVKFNDGTVTYHAKANSNYVRPVRGDPSGDGHELPDTGQYGDYTATFGEDSDYNFAASSPSYTDDGLTITDNKTGLMWVKVGNSSGCFNGNTMTWEVALSSCETLSYAGHDDWRLPNVRELESIVNAGMDSPATDETYFASTWNTPYWTSTTDVAMLPSELAWCVSFSNGIVDSFVKTADERVRPVRGGP